MESWKKVLSERVLLYFCIKSEQTRNSFLHETLHIVFQISIAQSSTIRHLLSTWSRSWSKT